MENKEKPLPDDVNGQGAECPATSSDGFAAEGIGSRSDGTAEPADGTSDGGTNGGAVEKNGCAESLFREADKPSRETKKKIKLPPLSESAKDDLRPATVCLDILVCFVSALLVSASLYYFSNYNHFAPGGITGIASILASLTAGHFGEMTLNMSIFMLALNIPIFILCAIFVSKKTGVMLIFYLVFQSLMLMLFKSLHARYDLSYYDAFDYGAGNNLVFASIGVGVISGFGFSLMIRRFGASGGTYAISALIKRFRPEKNLAWLAFVMDASVVVLAFFVYNSGPNAVICTLSNIFISDLVVDFMLQGLKSGYKFEIVTDRADELSAELMLHLGRGVTTLHAEGMYTHSEKALLICIVRKRQVGEFLKILKKYTSTFSYSCRVNEVYGKFANDPPRSHFFRKNENDGGRDATK